MKEDEMRLIASYISDVIAHINNESRIAAVAEKIKTLCLRFPLYQQRIKSS
jgi:glycine/serine hydroxymethyltransferase